MNRPALLPCPFCGCNPYFFNSQDPLAGNGRAVIACCVTMEDHYILPEHKPTKKDSEQRVVEKLIAAWNKRTGGRGMNQPTFNELNAAVNDVFQVIDIPGSRMSAIIALAELRNKKTTWVGKNENDLRFAIDKLLANYGAAGYLEETGE